MAVEKICGNCAWFDSNSETSFSEQQVRLLTAITANEAPTYGKCTAQFVDEDGAPARYDFGAFNIEPCSARDDGGNILFALGVYPGNSESPPQD